MNILLTIDEAAKLLEADRNGAFVFIVNEKLPTERDRDTCELLVHAAPFLERVRRKS